MRAPAPLLLLLAAAAAGCVSSVEGLEPPPPSCVIPGVTTRREVLELFGVPRAIRREPDGRRVLSFDRARGSGYAAGVGWRGLGVTVRDEDTDLLAVEVVLGPDGIVESARRFEPGAPVTGR